MSSIEFWRVIVLALSATAALVKCIDNMLKLSIFDV